jgi:hypothetical protein
MNDIDQLSLSIRKQLESLPDFGQLQIHVKRHLGTFNNTDVVKISSTKFNGSDTNVTATAMIFQLIKSIADAHETGTLSFNVSFKAGQAELMQVQDFRKI